jgi:hypothetical protein
LIDEKMRMRITPRMITAVPLMSVDVTAESEKCNFCDEGTGLTGAHKPVGEDEVEDE